MTGFIGWLDGREIPTDQYASIERAGTKFLHWVFELHPADAPFYLQTQIELHAWDYWSHLRTDQARTIDLTGDLTDAGRALGWLWLYAQTTHGRHAPAITTRSARLKPDQERETNFRATPTNKRSSRLRLTRMSAQGNSLIDRKADLS